MLLSRVRNTRSVDQRLSMLEHGADDDNGIVVEWVEDWRGDAPRVVARTIVYPPRPGERVDYRRGLLVPGLFEVSDAAEL